MPGKKTIRYSRQLFFIIRFYNMHTRSLAFMFNVASRLISRVTGGMRRGYMGHLTRIANTVVHNLEKGPVHAQISGLITGSVVLFCVA